MALPYTAQVALNSVDFRLSYVPQPAPRPAVKTAFPDFFTLAEQYRELAALGWHMAARELRDKAACLAERWFDYDIQRDEAQCALLSLIVRAELLLYNAVLEHAEQMTAARASCARTAANVDSECGF
jgi:hypothetical protein